MHIPTSEITEVHKFIFDAGCIVVEHNRTFDPYPYLNISNFKVMKIVKSLTSMGCLDKCFAWKHGYYTLTTKGIEYLRKRHYLTENDYPSLYDSDPLANLKKVEEEEEEIVFKE